MKLLQKSLLYSLFLLLAPLSGNSLPAGLTDHGAAMPVSNGQDYYITANSDGETILIRCLSDCQGLHSLLEINIEKASSRVIELPVPPGIHSNFTSLFSSRERLYLAFGGRFYEYDPKRGEVTFVKRCSGKAAIIMHEDRRGRIWAASYPGSELCVYDPASGAFRDYGSIYRQDWRQYPRFMADDDAGWLYVGIGNTASQIIAFHPETGTGKPVIPDSLRVKAACGEVASGETGNVYGWNRIATKDSNVNYELHAGQIKELPQKPSFKLHKRNLQSGGRPLRLPDGRKIEKFDLVSKELILGETNGKERKIISFDYPTAGLYIMGITRVADDTLRGGTMHPMMYFVFDPAHNKFTERGKTRYQWNVVHSYHNHLYIGGYSRGILLDWDTGKPHSFPEEDKDKSLANPRNLGSAFPVVNRPHCIIVSSDGKHLLLSGTPGYGRTGGGLMIYDRSVNKSEIIKPDILLGEQAIYSMLPLSGSQVLLGGTVSPGTGGQVKAKAATLAIFDLNERRIIWNKEILPKTKQYTEMLRLPDNRILLIAGQETLAVFNPETRQIEKIIQTGALGEFISPQGPGIMHLAGKKVLLIFTGCIGEFEPESSRLTQLIKFPEKLKATTGGAIIDNRLYFCARSHLYSYQFKQE